MIQANAQTFAAYLNQKKSHFFFFSPLVLLYFLFSALKSSPGFIPQAELLFAQRDEPKEEDFGEIFSYAGKNNNNNKKPTKNPKKGKYPNSLGYIIGYITNLPGYIYAPINRELP